MYNVYRCIPNFQTKPGETLLRPGDSQREVGHFLTDRISWDHICYWEWKPCVAVQGINLYVKVVPWRLRMPARIVFGKEKHETVHCRTCMTAMSWSLCFDQGWFLFACLGTCLSHTETRKVYHYEVWSNNKLYQFSGQSQLRAKLKQLARWILDGQHFSSIRDNHGTVVKRLRATATWPGNKRIQDFIIL